MKFTIAILFCLAIARGAFAEDPKKVVPPAQDQMMQEWNKYAKPGEFHKWLEQLEGTWTAKTTYWTAPGAKPETSKGSSINKTILGGRFLQQDFHGNFMGNPFAGVGITGYDNYREKFMTTWVDSMSTFMLTTIGTFDPLTRSVVFTGQYDDPMTKAVKKTRSVLKVVNKDQHTFQMFEQGPDGKEFKSLEISYSRS